MNRISTISNCLSFSSKTFEAAGGCITGYVYFSTGAIFIAETG